MYVVLKHGFLSLHYELLVPDLDVLSLVAQAISLILVKLLKSLPCHYALSICKSTWLLPLHVSLGSILQVASL